MCTILCTWMSCLLCVCSANSTTDRASQPEVSQLELTPCMLWFVDESVHSVGGSADNSAPSTSPQSASSGHSLGGGAGGQPPDLPRPIGTERGNKRALTPNALQGMPDSFDDLGWPYAPGSCCCLSLFWLALN